MYIYNKMNNSLQKINNNIIPDNYVEFPEKFLSIFYKSRIIPGVINVEYNEDETKIVNVTWDEERYQRLLFKYEENKEKEELIKSNEELTKENELLKTQIKALSDNQTFLEDCLIEVGQVVYA